MASRICQALDVHTQIEHEIFYPAFLAATGDEDGGLLKIVSPSQVLFGTDLPYRTTQEQVLQLQRMGLSGTLLQDILGGNADRLLST